jgi:hypothetical protein
MSDDKRMERLMKRAKPFLDDKLKASKRFIALKSVLGSSANFRDRNHRRRYEEVL